MTDPESQLGRVLSGRYRINELIAMGGMGAVYLGEHLNMKKRVAIKLLLPHAKNHPQLVERFEREAVAGAQVTHENVAAATDFGQEEDGTRFLVMEHVAGSSARRGRRRGAVEPGARRWRSLRTSRRHSRRLHERGIVHRDLKPANVIVGERVKIIDFGFAKVDTDRLSLVDDAAESSSKKALTEAGDVFGTVRYMAPEVVRGMGELDGRADLYAPRRDALRDARWPGHRSMAKAPSCSRRIRSQEPPPIAERSPDVVAPPELEALIHQLLAKAPAGSGSRRRAPYARRSPR